MTRSKLCCKCVDAAPGASRMTHVTRQCFTMFQQCLSQRVPKRAFNLRRHSRERRERKARRRWSKHTSVSNATNRSFPKGSERRSKRNTSHAENVLVRVGRMGHLIALVYTRMRSGSLADIYQCEGDFMRKAMH